MKTVREDDFLGRSAHGELENATIGFVGKPNNVGGYRDVVVGGGPLHVENVVAQQVGYPNGGSAAGAHHIHASVIGEPVGACGGENSPDACVSTEGCES